MTKLNMIYDTDCVDGMAGLPAGSVDVIVTSPPYNIGKAYTTYDDTIPRNTYLKWMRTVAAESLRVLSDQGSFYLNVGGSLKDPWIPIDVAQTFREQGFVLQNMIHWIKSIALPEEGVAAGHYKPINSKRYHNDCHEFIFHFTKKGAVEIDRLANGVPYQDKSNVNRWGGEKRDIRDRGNTWFIPYETIRESRPHPATFPVQLPMMCIKDHGLENCRLVMDPFMGIGNTAVAAIRLGIPFIGFEIDECYRNIANARAAAEMREAAHPLGKT